MYSLYVVCVYIQNTSLEINVSFEIITSIMYMKSRLSSQYHNKIPLHVTDQLYQENRPLGADFIQIS